jgi:putative salt-induced outer membrane protein
MPLPNPRSRSNHSFPGWWVFLLVIPVSLHADPITLVLKNGDRISGNVQSESAEAVTIESLLGPLKIPAGMIARRESAVIPSAGTPSAPPAAPPSAPTAHPLPASPQGTHSDGQESTNHGTISTVAVPAVSPATHGWNLWNQAWIQPLLTNWHGNIQLGMDLGFGTAERRTFYANGTANHTWNRVRDLLEYHVAYGIVNKLESANKMDGSIKTDVDLGDKRRLYVYMHVGAGYDSIRHMDLSLDAGPGVGYKFLDRPRLKLSGEVGAQYQKIDYDNSPGKSFFSARLGESLVWNVWEKLTFTQRLSYLPSVSDPEDYRIRFDLTAAYPVFKKVTISLNIIDQYESRPTVSVHNNDLEIQSTLGLTF